MITIFWISLAILFYCYLGYGIILFFLNKIRIFFKNPAKSKADKIGFIPVTLIVAVYNEATILEEKIRNTLAIDYPSDKLQIIFVDDGSSDDSANIIRKYPSVKLLQQEVRSGKIAAIKRAMRSVKTPVVVFSDANSMLNKESIHTIVSHYSNKKVGGVAGEKKIFHNQNGSAIEGSEGLYWKYESFMKQQDSLFHTVVGAAGELFSIRTDLFKETDDAVIVDDFIISMQICLQGYLVKYEPEAYSAETASASLAEEQKRKIRISAGAYQSIGYLKQALNFISYPLLSFQYISRRLLRWIFCPFLIPLLLIANIFIVMNTHGNFYDWFLYGQCVFYILTLVGWIFTSIGKRASLFTIPFYFVFMNYCLLRGLVTFIQGKQTVLWKKSLRNVIQNKD